MISNNNLRVVTKLRRCQPRKETDTGTFDVSLSTESILSDIKYVLRSGIPPFDDITGGIPFGRVTELYGLPGCGKSALVQRLAIQAQRGEIYAKDGTLVPSPTVTVLYVDNEQSIDSDRTVIDGTKLEVVLTRCDTVDQMFKIIDTTIKELHDIEKDTGVPQFVVVIVDTIAGTSSASEMTQAWDKEDYARQPRVMSSGFRRITRKINRYNVAMICVNQARDSFKQKGYSSHTSFEPQDADFSTFGGKALGYYSSLRVFMYAQNPNYRFSKASRNSQGILIAFKTTKNRTKKPYRKAHMVLLFEGGLNSTFSVLESLIKADFATLQDDGTIQFKLKAHGVDTTDFELPKRKQNPEIKTRLEWPAFYQAHKPAFDALWSKVIAAAFNDESNQSTESERDETITDADYSEDDDSYTGDPLNTELNDETDK